MAHRSTQSMILNRSKVLTALFFFYCCVEKMDVIETFGSPYCYKKGSNRELAFGWICDASIGTCLKLLTKDISTKDCLLSLNVCKLLCNTHGSLWPRPTKKFHMKNSLIPIETGKMAFKVNVSEHSRNLWNLFEELQHYYLNAVMLSLKRNKPVGDGYELVVNLKVRNESVYSLTYDTPEGYNLTLSSTNHSKYVEVIIEGENYFGIRHGIETLLQLIVYDEISNLLLLPQEVRITDEPIFKHRGILLDTSRSFYSVKSIKRTLDGMAQNKLNTFHWHITDSHSFPFQSKTYPQMTVYGAYSKSQIYSHKDIEEIVKYARIRGIKIIPEFDAPSHVGEGWQYFEEELHSTNDSVVLCFKAEPWKQYCVEPPCGILNPINEYVYEILNNLYAEFNYLFDSDVFHMGGDEVSFHCWQNTPSIIAWMKKRNETITDASFLKLWIHFQNKALRQFDKSAKINNGRVILWTSSLTESKNLTQFLDKKRYTIQIWTTIEDEQIISLLENGYNLIFSNYDALYFDCGFGAWIGEGNNWCSPYSGWQKVYMNDPLKRVAKHYGKQGDFMVKKFISQFLGSEGALWSEQSDDSTLDSRLWPRGCALAERLWTNPTTDWKSAESRILTQRERMLMKGIGSDLIQPTWCHQNEGLCY